MGQLLDDLQNEKPAELRARSIESMNWFRNNLRQIRVRSSSLMDEFDAEGALQLGQMYMFFYDAKTQDKLPYWDYFPLCIPIKRYKTGFMGLNLHYLPIDLRQQLYYRLLPRATTTVFTEYTRLKIDYNFLKSRNSLRAFKACIRRYRYEHMIGKMAHVPANEWELTVHLPLALWRKSSEQKIHQDSRKIARRIS